MMTNDELDLLASSYLDGEATPDEVALVEADPELRARVEQLRSVRVIRMAAPPGLAQAQLARAMAAYVPSGGVGRATDASADASTTDRTPETEAVIDLSERRRQPEGRLRWLTSAAAVLVVGIGTVAVINRMGDGDDAEMATADMAAESEATTTAAAQAEMAEAAPAADDSVGDDSAGNESAGGEAETLADFDAAAEEETAEAADAEEALALDEAAADAADAPGAERTLRNLPESGFFPEEPAAVYDRLPTGDEMVGDLDLPWRDEATASCLEGFPSDDSPYALDEVEVIAYLPFEVTGGDDAGVYEALYVIVNEADEVVVVLQAGSCTPVV